MDEQELLQQYLSDGRADAFTALVRQNADLVYSAARRQIGDPHLAQDVAQAVFILLARKARRIKGPLAPWLMKATFYACKDARRIAARRTYHERRAMELRTAIAPPPDEPAWEIFAPVLDQVLMELGETDRAAITLRYFKNLALREVGHAQGITEEAARKRIDRALERLRGAIARLTTTPPTTTPATTAFAGLLATRAVEAAPAAVLHSLLATGHTAAAGTLAGSLANSTAKLMTWLKIKFALAAGGTATFIAATGTLAWTALTLLTAAPSSATALPTATRPAITLKPGEKYQGWVHVAYGDEKEPSFHFNTDTGSTAERVINEKSGVLYIDFDNWLTGESYSYQDSTNLIRRHLLAQYPPYPYTARPSEFAGIPVTYSALLDQLHARAKAAVAITKSVDRGLDRYDIAINNPTEPTQISFVGARQNSQTPPPSSVWVDPKTDLICQAVVDGNVETFTYGGPQIATIYDVGVPRDARVYDNRPTPEARVVIDRTMARGKKPFPDGLLVRLVVDDRPPVGFRVYYRSGAHWAVREYKATVGAPEQGKVAIPDHWQDTGADELFRRLDVTMPEMEEGGDGTTAWESQFNKATGEREYMDTVPDPPGNPKRVLLPGIKQVADDYAQELEKRDGSTMILIYPNTATNAYASVSIHLDLITSIDRPGEVALRSQYFKGDVQEIISATVEEWIDPAHDDRAVAFISRSATTQYRKEQQFGDYATFPAPDGRSYPTTMTETSFTPDANGNLVPKVTGKVTFHYFPGKSMPDIPKHPAPA